MKKLFQLSVLVTGLGINLISYAQDVAVPNEINLFIKPNTTVIAYKAVDLNADSLQDAIIVLERPSQSNANPFNEHQRTLLILQRNIKGQLIEVAKNDKVVQCARCGGTQDPFVADEAFEFGKNWFSLTQESSSGTKHNSIYTFTLLKDKRWYLKRVETNRTVNTKAGIDVIKRVKTYPKNFSKILFSQFDPSSFARQYKFN